MRKSLGDRFAANLLAACKKRGYTQRDLSRRSGVALTHISRIFMRKANPSLEICEQLATAVGCTAEKIFQKIR